ncbi:epsin-3 [Scleropages formosus]|uniref:Epsin 3a n=1 Tax=Scleropages formosus TaxID=113540 RepID=A0A8C9VYP2_SCLFO|nr:epsin-3-like [Scleropages formosus]XP_018612796.1 epsin-3-like [Scleropages formosus]XP_018612797.1 epsin-3-like [Scleropages formosus]XP_018612798.1 epsin-3-like [Scleropages formosus]XP_018612800.1 epsin-3-like [Scleropages formosus]XP_018612801.1 epsin-3-like [Scleropages formosus]
MTTSSLRRQVKNIVHNYTDAEVKVREATSNDPWGPSSALMSEIAELTYSMPAFFEVMGMIWKRLNDHGKNWRHVHKALILLEYLVKAGSERVAQQCRENMITIQTLRDFQYVDRDGRDQGVAVREKARHLATLVRDEEKLQRLRTQALGARGHQATSDLPPPYPGQQTSIQREGYSRSWGSPSSVSSSSSPSRVASDLEQARPQTSGEEELQLQVALAMSREESEKPRAPVDADEQAQLETALRLSKENQKATLPPPVALDIDEETQLQIALSLSEAEHQQEQRSRQGDESLLRKALEESRREIRPGGAPPFVEDDIFRPLSTEPPSGGPWDLNTVTAHIQAGSQPNSDPWDSLETSSPMPGICKPWVSPPPSYDIAVQPGQGLRVSPPDPWEAPNSIPSLQAASQPAQMGAVERISLAPHPGSSNGDPFSAMSEGSSVANTHQTLTTCRSGSPTDGDLFGESATEERQNGSKGGSPEAFDLSGLAEPLTEAVPRTRPNPEAFLGPNAASLVDLDNLIPSSSAVKPKNPFLSELKEPLLTNPFHSDQTVRTVQTLNQIHPSSASSQPPMALPYSTSLPLPLTHLPSSLPPSYSQPPAYPAGFGLTVVPDNLPEPLLPFSAAPPGGDQSSLHSQNPFL